MAQPVALAAAGAADRTVIEALRIACDRGWVTPIVVGCDSEIRRVATECGNGLGGFEIVDSDDPANRAVAEVRTGRARMLMKGQISTPALMRAVLDTQFGLRGSRVICQVVLIEICRSGRRFLMADTGICVQPGLEQKIDIVRSTVQLAHALGKDLPRVAMMAATEKVSAAMPETLDAADLQRRCQAGEFPGCIVQGPLSFDLAYAADVGEKKQVAGQVVGVADAMVFPNLLSANLAVKAIMYTAECRFGGVLLGASCPVVFMSRADTTTTRLNSLALALKLVSARSQ